MSRFLFKFAFHRTNHSIHFHSTIFLSLSQNPSLLKPLSTTTTTTISKDQTSFTISYLIENCGLSQEKAISASKHFHFNSPERPNSVLNFLSENGFTKTQITNFISKRPSLLLSDLDNKLKPKFEFLHSLGFSVHDLAKVLSADPAVLKRSLHKQLIPSLDFLKSVVGTESNVLAMIKRSTWVLLQDPKKQLIPNIAILRYHGVSNSNICLLLRTQPRSLLQSSDRFKQVVEMVEEMGFDPSKCPFVKAVHGLTSMSKLTWESKWEIYRKWGWSDEEIRKAFRKQPQTMMASEKKIARAMNFLVKEMGFESPYIAKHPMLILLSLEKRIIPRCLVIRVLKSKGVLKKDVSVPKAMMLVEKRFLEKFVIKFEKEVPEILKTYQGKINCL